MKLGNKSKTALLISLTVLLAVLLWAFSWIKNNTSFLTSNIPEDQLVANNFNRGSDESFELYATEIAGETLNIPKGFTIHVFAEDIESARFMALNESNTLFVGTKNSDKIYAVRDSDNDGKADKTTIVDEGLRTPHSVYYFDGDLYLGEETRVSVYRDITDEGSYSTKQVLIDDLPEGDTLTGGGHTTRTVVVGPDRKLYISIGSSCNVCEEDDERRATLLRYDLDGENEEIVATGLRNTVGFLFDGDDIVGVDMGRDQIGDDIPPEEINIIEQGRDYGWPYCYGSGIYNPEFKEKEAYCKDETTNPVFEMQAHSAPLGIAMLNQAAVDSWPAQYKDGYFIAFHGSWNRTIPTGYKVVFVKKTDSGYKQYNFISGWLEEDADAWGRPVGVTFGNDGSMYVSDDKNGTIYRIAYSTES